MSRAWQTELAAECDAWRAELGAIGFSDDGNTLRGPVVWRHPDGQEITATIEVTITSSFPFNPPRVQVLDPGMALELTFHRDPDGALCLWPSDTEVGTAPWQEPTKFLNKVAAWLEATAAGWPDDDDCDLERYLLPDSRMVLYDRNVLAGARGCMRTFTGSGLRVAITGESQRPPKRHQNQRRNGARRKHQHVKIRRKQRRLAWIADIGQADRPINNWASLLSALGPDADEVSWLVSIGVVEFIAVRYLRGGRDGVLVVAVHPVWRGTIPEIRACASADTSTATRMMRAGSAASTLADSRIAVVGLGAVGSFTADLLFRCGVRQLTLFDPQRLRPGNPVRHLAGAALVGYPKTTAVKLQLAELGFDVSGVNDRFESLATSSDAVALLDAHDLVVDATANTRTSAMLAWAAHHTERPVVSVCIQRQGGLVRIDRFPLRDTEQHLPALPPVPGAASREHGCDEPVSSTPPTSVIAAAELASRAVIDELTNDRKLTATLVNVLVPQESPYEKLGLRMSRP